MSLQGTSSLEQFSPAEEQDFARILIAYRDRSEEYNVLFAALDVMQQGKFAAYKNMKDREAAMLNTPMFISSTRTSLRATEAPTTENKSKKGNGCCGLM